MEGRISVKKALRFGAILFFVIPVLLIPGELYLFWLMLKYEIFPFNSILPRFVQLCCVYGFFFGGIVVSPRYWYFILFPYWYIWAFSNVRNVHELRRKATYLRILRADGNLKSRLLVATGSQKQKVYELEARFQLADNIVDDGSIPENSIIKNSKSSIWIMLSLSAIFMSIAISGIYRQINPLSFTFSIIFFLFYRIDRKRLYVCSLKISDVIRGEQPNRLKHLLQG